VRVLTIRQPWIGAILAGRKRIENRSWRADSVLGERILLHAGARFDGAGAMFCKAHGWTPPAIPELGAIVGSARVVDFIERSRDPWFMGPIGWVLEDVRSFQPIPCLGKLGLWRPSIDVLAKIPDGCANRRS